jgi:hypothetical protein
MLPTSSTSPSPEAPEVVDANGSAIHSTGWGYPSPSSSTSLLSPVVQAGHSYTLASPPVSSTSILGEEHDLELDLSSPRLTDEDQDMSEGGAPLSEQFTLEELLSILPGHAQELDAELDMLDAEVVGQAGQDGLYVDISDQPATINEQPFSFSTSTHVVAQNQQSSDDFDDDMLYDEFEPAEVTSLPTTMLEVSQQLEHLQDTHENVDFPGITEAQHDNMADHSISPPLLLTLYAIGESSEEASQEDVVSSAGPSSLNPQGTALAQGLPGVLHPGNHGGFVASAGADDVTPSQVTISQFNPLEITWDDIVSEADQPEVDDQFNLSLGDFLYTWARMNSRRDGSASKGSRFPALHSILRQRGLRKLEPVVRSDLHGDRCDIQRLDWDDLGVTRLEAKKMRKRTYKNYTNLRLPAQWHVSTHLFDMADLRLLTEI